jgi:hypothetical protein
MALLPSTTLDNARPSHFPAGFRNSNKSIISGTRRLCYTPFYMPERLHQFRFDEQFQPTPPQDVTPAHFAGLRFPARTPEILLPSPAAVGRFVREAKERVFASSPAAAAEYLLAHVFYPFEQFDQEEAWVLLLNTKNEITHDAMVYRGTINTMNIRVAEVFKEAVKVNAHGLIFSHCHPSGDANPSPEDVQVTRTVSQAGQLLGVELVDHIVVGRGCWVSLKERGLGIE